MKDHQTCARCKYAFPSNADAQYDKGGPPLECRRRAPTGWTSSFAQGVNPDGSIILRPAPVHYPSHVPVQPTHGCGEWAQEEL